MQPFRFVFVSPCVHGRDECEDTHFLKWYNNLLFYQRRPFRTFVVSFPATGIPQSEDW